MNSDNYLNAGVLLINLDMFKSPISILLIADKDPPKTWYIPL